MKKTRQILCLLLALAMVFALCACAKTEEKPAADDKSSSTGTDSGKTETADNTKTEEDKSSSSGTSADITAQGNNDKDKEGVTTESGITVIQDTVILNMEEYENRPHEIQPGTNIKFVMFNDVPAQLPWNDSSEAFLYNLIYEGLLYAYLGKPDDIRGCIAETWEHSDDYLDWTFNIREGVKFTDGTVCDANAIAKCWDYFKELTPTNLSNVNIESYEAESDLVFKVHLSSPCAYFENAMCGNGLCAISPTACEKYGTDNNQAAVGTAPYYIESYTSGVELILKANPDYYLYEKMPCLETITYVNIKDTNTMVMALLNGDVDGAVLSDLESYYSLRDNNYAGDLIVKMSNVGPFMMNAKKYEPFQKFEVRKAFARYVNYNEVNDLVWDGMAIVNDSMWAKGTSGYWPSDDYYPDADEGDELLASIGMSPSDISFSCTTMEGDNVMEAIQDQLNKHGIHMEIEVIESAANFTYLMNGDWTVTYGSVGYTNSSPYTPWTFILPPNGIIKQCWQDVYDPELYDQMMDEFNLMKSSKTWDEMLDHCHALTGYVQDDHGCLLGMQRPGFLALSKEFKGGVFYALTSYPILYYFYV